MDGILGMVDVVSLDLQAKAFQKAVWFVLCLSLLVSPRLAHHCSLNSARITGRHEKANEAND